MPRQPACLGVCACPAPRRSLGRKESNIYIPLHHFNPHSSSEQDILGLAAACFPAARHQEGRRGKTRTHTHERALGGINLASEPAFAGSLFPMSLSRTALLLDRVGVLRDRSGGSALFFFLPFSSSSFSRSASHTPHQHHIARQTASLRRPDSTRGSRIAAQQSTRSFSTLPMPAVSLTRDQALSVSPLHRFPLGL